MNYENMTSRKNRVSVTRGAEFTTREENEKKTIAGYFVVFNSLYELGDGDAETIAPTAFDKWRNTDIRALTNHDDTLVLGRTTAGTVRIRIDEVGLYAEIDINEDDRRALDTYRRVKRGDVTQCSFGFNIMAEEWSDRENGGILWTITDIDLYEISVCTFPAYRDTVVNARAADAKAIRQNKIEAWKVKALKRLRG